MADYRARNRQKREDLEQWTQEDEKIALRPLTLADSALVVKWRNNPRVREHYIYMEEFTLEGQRAYYHDMVETGRVFQFTILEKPSLRPVGCTVLSSYDPEKGEAESGIFIGEDTAAGKGYAERALRMTNEFGFRELGLREIYSRIFTDNTRSLRSYRKAGFVMDCLLPVVERSDGSRKDMYRLRIRNPHGDAAAGEEN